MTAIVQDIRFALRKLGRRPGFAALAVFTLALGIGANTAIFSVVHAVLLAPLPYSDADRLVQVWNKYPLMNLPQASVSVPDYLDRRSGVESFEESALYYFDSFNLADAGPPERVIGVRATASLFPLVRTAPALGQVFGEPEEELGREKVVVLSHDLWQGRFGGDRAVVGRDLRLDGEPYRVLGVMPAAFRFPSPEVKLWTPFAFTPEQRSDDSRGREFSQMLARLGPDASAAAAQAEIDAVHEANKERFPDSATFWNNSGFGGMVVPYREQLFGEIEPVLLLLQGVVGLVLLIACVNVANLLLARVHDRQKELAVRTALGAGRFTLARELMAESLVLALSGAAAGVWLGVLGTRLLGWLGVDPTAGRVDVDVDLPVLAFTLGVALATALVFGLFPVVYQWRLHPNAVLKEGSGRGASAGAGAALWRHGLVVTEIALAMMLLVGAGLLVRTFAALQNEDPGFTREGVLTARVSLPDGKYAESDAVAGFFDRALERVRALPGVTGAGIVSSAPFSGMSSSGSYSVEGYAPGAGESAPHGLIRIVDEEYFRTLDVPVLQGRTFTAADRAGVDAVVVVDRLLADKYFPDADPIGRRISRGGPDGPFFTIVGVVAPVKVRQLDQPVTKETIYASFRQRPERNMTFVVRTSADPASLAQPLRDAVLAVDPEQPTFDLLTMEEQVAGSLETRRVSMLLLVAFGGLALVLAAVGIYGVLAFSVGRRVRELGTRMALGASRRDILGLVLGQGLKLTLAGLAAGVVLTLLLARFLAALLFGVASHDPATLGAVGVFLAAVALAACFRPAWQASRLDPMNALRDE
ncbi:MAG TPA: ABC transporter permease [Methylomirabilota bacterium]|jgi:predicted permease